MGKIKHIGIILDGNRRFAKRLMKEPWKGHEFGAEKVYNVFEWCKEFDIREITLYTFSMQNFNRPKLEFNYLMKLFKDFFSDEKYIKQAHENKIRVKFVGRIHLFPEEVYERMKKIEEETKDYSDYKINFAMAYGGREEMIDAVKKVGRLIEEGKITDKEITEELIEKNLYMAESPDLIIRTGGEQRTSNFLIWQSNYSEWFFVEKMWPDFEKEDFIKILEEYSERERRFGK
jgi:tritrans,polycis-undecaprenyl-diphosphate synthase [geranylgeranyl-diphosphate specific]